MMTTADLPLTLRSNQEPVAAITRAEVLTCAHGVACPSCVLAAARVLLAADASLAGPEGKMHA